MAVKALLFAQQCHASDRNEKSCIETFSDRPVVPIRVKREQFATHELVKQISHCFHYSCSWDIVRSSFFTSPICFRHPRKNMIIIGSQKALNSKQMHNDHRSFSVFCWATMIAPLTSIVMRFRTKLWISWLVMIRLRRAFNQSLRPVGLRCFTFHFFFI